MEKRLSDKDIDVLRNNKLMSDEEIAFIIGDSVIAENILTKLRRKLSVSNDILLESKKRILND